MHELAICQSLLDQTRRIARAHGAGGVARIVVRIGPLSGVEAPLLRQAFAMARIAAGFAATGLDIEIAPLRVQCRQCGASSAARVNALLCGACGGWQVDVTSGDEMILKSLVLDDVPQAETMTAQERENV